MRALHSKLMTTAVVSLLACTSFAETICSDWNDPDAVDLRDGWICGNADDGYTGNLTGGDPGATVTWDPLDGGCLRLYDPAVQAGDYFIASAKFLVNGGDWLTGYSEGSISFWYRKGEPLQRVPEVRIGGAGDQWLTGTKPGWESVFDIYADTEWHRYEVSLEEANWYRRPSHNSGKPWQEAFRNISDMGVTGDLKIGEETNHLDEFCLELIPLTITAAIDIDPDTLNMKSNGKWITCYISLPEGYSVAAIEVDSIRLEDSLEVEHSNIQDAVLLVKFNRSELQGIVEPGEVHLTVTGEFTNGARFEGSDTITVVDPGKK